VINRSIPLKAANNHYFLEGANEADLAAVRRQLLDSHETDSSVVLESSKDSLADPTSRATGWRLVARAPTHALAGAPDLAGLFISLSVSALQFSHSGLQVSLSGDGAILQTADDWSLPLDGVQLNRQERAQNQPFSLKLIAPGGRVARSWTGTPSPIDLGLALRRALGAPDYGRLKVVPVTATD
jgi:hypothetical protein